MSKHKKFKRPTKQIVLVRQLSPTQLRAMKRKQRLNQKVK